MPVCKIHGELPNDKFYWNKKGVPGSYCIDCMKSFSKKRYSKLKKKASDTNPIGKELNKESSGEVVLVIGDLHEPFTHNGYFPFVKWVKEMFQPTKTIFIGDVVDNHAISYHESDPDGLSAGHELEATKLRLQKWYKEYPDATITIGNHDNLVSRKGITNGIPKFMIKDFPEIWNSPRGWSWVHSVMIDNVQYTHKGGGGVFPARMAATHNMTSFVCGHSHTAGGVVTMESINNKRIFAAQTGCGMDDETYASAYAKDVIKKSALGCLVVIGGTQPIYIDMPDRFRAMK